MEGKAVRGTRGLIEGLIDEKWEDSLLGTRDASEDVDLSSIVVPEHAVTWKKDKMGEQRDKMRDAARTHHFETGSFVPSPSCE